MWVLFSDAPTRKTKATSSTKSIWMWFWPEYRMMVLKWNNWWLSASVTGRSARQTGHSLRTIPPLPHSSSPKLMLKTVSSRNLNMSTPKRQPLLLSATRQWLSTSWVCNLMAWGSLSALPILHHAVRLPHSPFRPDFLRLSGRLTPSHPVPPDFQPSENLCHPRTAYIVES